MDIVAQSDEEKKNKDVITKIDKHVIIKMVEFLSFIDGIYFLSSNKKLAEGIDREKKYVEEKTEDIFKMLHLIYCDSRDVGKNSLERIYAGFIEFVKNYLFFEREKYCYSYGKERNLWCYEDIVRQDINKHQDKIIKSKLFLKKTQQAAALISYLLLSTEKGENKKINKKYGDLFCKRGWRKVFSFFAEHLFPDSYLMLMMIVHEVESKIMSMSGMSGMSGMSKRWSSPISYAQFCCKYFLYKTISFESMRNAIKLPYFINSFKFLGLSVDSHWLYRVLEQDKLILNGLWREAGICIDYEKGDRNYFVAGHTPLYMHTLQDNLHVVKALLAVGADKDKENRYGETPLFIASEEGHADIVTTLLALGADKDKGSSCDNRTPLHAASDKDDINIVNALLAAGADQDKTDNNGVTPLLIASQEGHAGIVAALLVAGADKDQADNNGITPLLIASAKGHAGIVTALLAAGADPNKANNNGSTPLLVASQKGYVNVAILVRKISLHYVYYVLRRRNINVVKALLVAGADKDGADDNGVTPLFAASNEGHLDIVKALIAEGVDVNKARKYGATPLFAASGKGYLNIVQALHAAGADVNKARKDGATPLSIVQEKITRGRYYKDDTIIVNLLLAAGADPNKATVDPTDLADLYLLYIISMTIMLLLIAPVVVLGCLYFPGVLLFFVLPILLGGALGYVGASFARNIISDKHNFMNNDLFVCNVIVGVLLGELIGLILFLNAIPLLPVMVIVSLVSSVVLLCAPTIFKLCRSPLWAASRGGHIHVVNALLALGVDKDKANDNGFTPLAAASLEGHLNIVQALLAVNADKDKENRYGETPLFIASQEGHADIVTALLAAGADKDKENRCGKTPLFIASQNGHADIVAALLAAGADSNKANDNGETPLHIALDRGHINVVNALLAAGADPNKINRYGETPLFIASQEGYVDVVNAFVNALLAIGADLNKPNNEGNTPLHIASQKGHANIVMALLVAGADKRRVNFNGETPLSIAQKNDEPAMVNLLLEAEVDKVVTTVCLFKASNNGIFPPQFFSDSLCRR